VPAWKSALGWIAAVLLALAFLASGLWKITDVQGAAVRMAQAQVPEWLSLAAALGFGVAETVTAALLLAPGLRRWGAILAGTLLLAFLVHVGLHYGALRGQECSCFPWLKRVVGPAFFVGDGVMLSLAVVAGITSVRPRGVRTVAVIAGAVTVFAAVSWGVGAVRPVGTPAPDSVLVEGRPYALGQGRVFLFYFDPACAHCFDAAQRMAHLHWGDTRVVGVPVERAEYAGQFVVDTGLRMAITSDVEKLRRAFPNAGVPAGVALQGGREVAPLTKFDGEEPGTTLRRLGLVY
jgi:uncharacterized membrane protein YphA (DoxX/SURF4 family)